MRVATQILKDELGDDDPDYEYFKHLEETLWSYLEYSLIFTLIPDKLTFIILFIILMETKKDLQY